MKKILFISFAILLMCGVAFAATPGNATSPGHGDIMNQGGFNSNPPKHFVMVRYVPPSAGANSPTLTADSIVIWDTTSDDGVTVTTTTTSGDNAVAGIIVNNALTPDTIGNTAFADIGKRNWTWLQTYGLSDVIVEHGAAVAAKSAIGTSTTSGKANAFISGTVEAGVKGVAGFAFDNITGSSNTTGEVFIRCE